MFSTIEAPSLSPAAAADLLAEKNAGSVPVLGAAFAEMAGSEQFNVLVLAFDTLVNDIRTEGVTPWATALLKAIDDMANRFLSASPAGEYEQRIGARIEDCVYAGLRGRRTSRRVIPYTRDELLGALIGTAVTGRYDSSLDFLHRAAVSGAGDDFSGFSSVTSY